MNKATSRVAARGLVWLSLLTLCALSSIACSKGSTQQAAAPTAATPKATPTNAKLALNNEPIGTTNDTSKLSETLARIFKQREEYRIYKKGTLDVDKTLYLKADPSIRIGEFLKVLDVAKEAGASPVLLPIEVSEGEDKDFTPDRLLLLLTIGNPEVRVSSRSIELIHDRPVRQSEKQSVIEMTGVISVAKDGEYVIGGKPVAKSDLANRIKSDLAYLHPSVRRVLVLLEADADMSYASLSEIVHAASEASIPALHITALAP